MLVLGLAYELVSGLVLGLVLGLGLGLGDIKEVLYMLHWLF